jgi:hypothetical protein
LDILTISSLCIFALMMFVVNNPDSFQSNSSVHCINTRQMNQLHFPLVKFSSIQKDFIYSSIRIFNHLPTNILRLHRDIRAFKSALRKFLVKNTSYSIDEFLSVNCDTN